MSQQEIAVIKSSGKTQPFYQNKIVQSVTRAVGEKEVAEKVGENVARRVHSNMQSAHIHNMVLEELGKRNVAMKFLYDLRRAVSIIEPHNFEVYIKKVLEAHGYSCRWDVLIRGASVEHQVDIVAEKENEKFLVEIKHHYDYHKMSGLGCVLQVQARLEDVRDGFVKGTNIYNFSRAWLINNTLFSDHAKTYAAAKNIRLSGWHYKEEESLERLIETVRVYPVTIFGINQYTENRLAQIGVITIQDLLEDPKKSESVLGIKETNKVMEEAKELLEYKPNPAL